MSHNSTKNRFLYWIITRFLKRSESLFLSGDFDELYKGLKTSKGGFFAGAWLWYQVIISLPLIIGFSFRRSFSMFKNYWKISLRGMLRNKIYTFINISGFAIGIASFLLISLHVKDEFSYDKFYKNSDRIYRVLLERTYPDRVTNWTMTSPFLANTLIQDYPEVETSTNILFVQNEVPVTFEDKNFTETGIAFADSNFFNVFDLPMLRGNRDEVLKKTHSAILTKETAEKYFGNEDPIGKTLTIPTGFEQETLYLINGVIDNIPSNSHFHFNVLLSKSSMTLQNDMSWFFFWNFYTYALVKENVNVQALDIKLQEIITNYFRPTVESNFRMSYDDYIAAGNGYKFFLQKLTDIHLHSHYDAEIEANGNITYVYIFGLVAFLILAIACVNFTNLTTAQSSKRMREIGVRKALGSARGQLIKQFLFESITLSVFSMILAIGIVQLILPYFENFTNKDLSISYFDNVFVIPGLLIFPIFTGILSGSYPAFFLSSFRPAKIFKGEKTAGSKGNMFRNSLVVFQFTSSILLISSTLIIKNQIEFLVNKDVGFDKENVLVIENANSLGNQTEAFKERLTSYSEILSLSESFVYPGQAVTAGIQRTRGQSFDKAVSMFANFVDYDFIKTLKMDITAGRDFSEEFSSDTLSVILNETAVQLLDIRNDPLTQEITNDGTTFFKIVGIVKDFNFQSLHSDIQPLYLAINRAPNASYLAVRLSPGNLSENISLIKKQWEEFTGGVPFRYSLLDENLHTFYVSEDRTEKISGAFSILAVVIGCLGLFGLSAFSADQKTRDIGIRKVLGATSNSIVLLLSREFIKLIGVSILLSVPLSYFLMREWLQSFAYSISMPYDVYVYSGVIMMVIAMFTISFQIIKAANKNPVDSLKYE